MMKFGFYKKEQLTPEKLNGFFGKRQFIALDIYNQLNFFSPDEVSVLQERMLGRLSVANGTFKYTFFNRFEDFDALCIDRISKNFPIDVTKSISVHDVGVSDGRTAADFFVKLRGLYGDNIDFTASDFSPFFKVVKTKKSEWRLILDHQDTLIQIVAPPFVFNMVQPESAWVYPLNFLWRTVLEFFYAKPLIRRLRAQDKTIDISEFPVICSACQKWQETEQFHFIQYDVMSCSAEQYDVVRVMNLLNVKYFSSDELKLALSNILDSLNVGGVLIVGSNWESGTVVNGAIYRKTQSGLEKLTQTGYGFFAEHLMSGFSSCVLDATLPANKHAVGAI